MMIGYIVKTKTKNKHFRIYNVTKDTFPGKNILIKAYMFLRHVFVKYNKALFYKLNLLILYFYEAFFF